MAIEVPASEGQELLDRVEQLTAAIDATADPFVRGTVDELVAAIIELYGEGLTRIVRELGGAGRGRAAPAARARRRDRQPHVDPRSLPGATRGPRGRGARKRAAVHGVARRRRASAQAGGRRRAPRARRPLPRLPGLGGHARARDQGGARGGRTRSARPRGRGRGGAEADPQAALHGADRRSGGRARLASVRAGRDDRARDVQGAHARGRRAGRRERRRHRAGLPRPLRGLRGVVAAMRRSPGRCSCAAGAGARSTSPAPAAPRPVGEQLDPVPLLRRGGRAYEVALA